MKGEGAKNFKNVTFLKVAMWFLYNPLLEICVMENHATRNCIRQGIPIVTFHAWQKLNFFSILSIFSYRFWEFILII